MRIKYIILVFCTSLLVEACAAQQFAVGMPSYAKAFAPPVTTTGSAETDNSNDSILTIKKRVSEVHVLFTATDRHGKFVRNLNENDFVIRDDNKPPQAVSDFRRETNLPLRLGLLIDTSGSVHGRFDFEQRAAIDFLQQTLRPKDDEAFVMGFSTHPQLGQDFTGDAKLLEVGVQRLREGGGTALYDAIYSSCKDKLAATEDATPARRALVILSDGEDNQSQVTRSQAIEMAQRAEVTIYAISTDDSGLVLRGDKVLQQIADSTGGRAFFPYKSKDIKNSFAAIAEELRSQYVISYHPADFEADGRYRSIEISALKKALQIRSRRGYFAPRQ